VEGHIDAVCHETNVDKQLWLIRPDRSSLRWLYRIPMVSCGGQFGPWAGAVTVSGLVAFLATGYLLVT
jgi:hypothetical protein